MKKLMITAAAVSALTVAAPAMAETYGSLGYSGTDVGAYNFDGVTGRFGWNSGFFGVEGDVTLGVGDDTVGANTARLNSNLGVFATAKGAVTPEIAVIGRLGYAQTELKSNGVKATDEGAAYGAGLEWSPGGGPNALRADYTKYDNSSDANVWSLSAVRKF